MDRGLLVLAEKVVVFVLHPQLAAEMALAEQIIALCKLAACMAVAVAHGAVAVVALLVAIILLARERLGFYGMPQVAECHPSPQQM